MDDAADEDYDFDYEEDDDEDVDADIENMYYNAKAKRSEDIDGAIADLEKVVEKEDQMGDWGFKALKQMTKANFRRGRHADALNSYTRLLKYTKSAVTRNYSEKSINSILDYVSADISTHNGEQHTVDLAIMEQFYDVTKHALEESKNERLSVKTDLKLARLWLARNEFGRLSKVSGAVEHRTESVFILSIWSCRFSRIFAATAPRPMGVMTSPKGRAY